MTTKTIRMKKEMAARRYAELFSISDAALDLFKKKYIDEDKNLYHIKFRAQHLLSIAVNSLINGVEAFINHIGFIFDNEWCKFEKKGFWDQYRRVINILNSIEVKTNDIGIDKSPYDEFKKYRESVRNTFNHVHPSEHDVKIYHKEEIDNQENDFKESYEMLNCWINLSYEETFEIYKKSIKFIELIHDNFEKNLFQSDKLVVILYKAGYFRNQTIVEISRDLNTIPFYNERQLLLERFMEDPLNWVAVVSGTSTIGDNT